MFFTDVNTGYAVGVGGTIIKTNNGGTTWTKQSSGTYINLHSVFFPDALTGYAVGGYIQFGGRNGIILKTLDGGTTWKVQVNPLTGHDIPFYSVFFIDINTGYVAGEGSTILKTFDGGSNWTLQKNGTYENLYSVFLIDANTVYAVGDEVYKTINGGLTWSTQVQAKPLISGNALTSVFFTDKNTGYTVGGFYYTESGTILKTTNGGLTWLSQSNIISKDGLLLYLPITTSIADISMNHLKVINHYGAPTTDRFGDSQSAVQLNGEDQYLSINDTLAFRPGSFTISGWYCFDSIPPGPVTLIDKNIGTGIFDAFNISFNNNIISAHTGDNTGNGTSSSFSFKPEKDSWFHVAFVFDSSVKSQKLYINGILADTAANTKKLQWDNHPILFGTDMENEKDTFFFKGKIDEIRVYNRALEPEEIYVRASEKDSVIIVQTEDYYYDKFITTLQYEGNEGIADTIMIITLSCFDQSKIRFPNFEEVKGLRLKVISDWSKQTVIDTIISNPEIDLILGDRFEGTIQILDKNNKVFKGATQKIRIMPGV